MAESNRARHTETTKKPKKKKYKIHWLRIILCILLVLTLVGGGVAFGVIKAMLEDIPSLDGASLDDYEVTSYILDKDGNYVDKLHAGEYRVPVDYKDISPNMINALTAIEDQRFWKHKGVDPIRIGGALVANIKAGRTVQGGSTITQQLAGMVLLDRQEKSYTRKLQEAVIAMQLEQRYSKEEIITAYLNRSFFGNNAYGVQAAAETFFNKSAKDLTITESALLAGMIQNPSKWSPINKPENAKSRRNVVLNQMVEIGAISESDCARYKEEPIVLGEFKSSNKTDGNFYANQSFIDHVINEAIDILDIKDNPRLLYTDGYVIYTTLDTRLQSYMESIYNDDSQFPAGDSQSILQSAAVLMESKTGAVRGIMGGRNQTGTRNLNRATQSVRQPGSSIKPIIVYGPAFEMGMSPGTVIDDYPKTYGRHVFKNYDHKYRGLMTIREAIKNSTNTVAVKTMEQVGVENCIKFAQNLGITSLVSEGNPNDLNLSSALGGLTQGVSPLEMAGAYGAFANNGIYNKPYVITKITDKNGRTLYEHQTESQAVMKEETAYMIANAMVSVVSESGGTGTMVALSGRQVAGKTGTTTDNKDYWFVGFTPQYVTTVWMGYDQPREVRSIGSAGRSCGPIFKKIMAYAHEGLPTENFPRPSGIVSQTIDTKSGLLPSEYTPAEYQKSEIFNKEFVPKETSEAWALVEIDPLSGELFTNKCPGAPETKVVLRRAIPWQENIAPGFTPADASLEEPTAECTIHANGIAVGDLFLTGSGKYSGEKLASVELFWQEYTGDGVSYEVHRANHSGFTPDGSTRISNTSGTSFTDRSPLQEDRSIYKVVVLDANGNRMATSNEVAASAKTSVNQPTDNKPDDTKQPSNNDNKPSESEGEKPFSNVTLVASVNSGNIVLSWNAPGNGDYQYYIFRSENSTVAANSLNQIGASSAITTTSYSDTAAESGKTYYYKILVVDRSNNEQIASSNTVQVNN